MAHDISWPFSGGTGFPDKGMIWWNSLHPIYHVWCGRGCCDIQLEKQGQEEELRGVEGVAGWWSGPQNHNEDS